MIDKDESYGEASLKAFGRNVAVIFSELVENGMTREEALEILNTWITTIAPSPRGD